jgi:hypothetical protein
MNHLDKQMSVWAPRIKADLGVSVEASTKLATTIASETRALPEGVRSSAAGGPISRGHRLDELVAFQTFLESTASTAEPPTVRAQVVVTNYICFVYLGESCFKALRNEFPIGSAGRACCRFLTDNPVRAFRNAIAHGNWRYKTDFSGLEFWARKGDRLDEPLASYEVTQHDLNFWQMVAMTTAYAIYVALDPVPEG